MSEAQWWMYDLVVLAIIILCVWNGVTHGLFRAIGGAVISIAACLIASVIMTPCSEMVYDAFLQKPCQNMIVQKLERVDFSDNVRSALEQRGLYLPLSDEQIAQTIQSISENEELAEQTAALLGIDKETLEEKISTALLDAIGSQEELLPDWAKQILEDSDKGVLLDTAADTAAALFSNDYATVSAEIEESYLRPAVLSVLRAVIFAAAAFVISFLLRVILLVLPESKPGTLDALLGGALGLVKASVYLCLIVLLVGGIASIQNGAYPFFSEEVVNRTALFRILYDIFGFMR